MWRDADVGFELQYSKVWMDPESGLTLATLISRQTQRIRAVEGGS